MCNFTIEKIEYSTLYFTEKNLKHFLKFFAFIVIIKILFLLFLGPLYENDSPRYFLNVRSLIFPPLYPFLLRIFHSLFTPNLYLTLVYQTIIFAFLSLSGLYLYESKQLKRTYFAIFIAFEPFSTFYCRNLMTEILFLGLMILYLGLIVAWNENRIILNRKLLHLFIIGFAIACLVLTKALGILFLPLTALIFIFNKESLKNKIFDFLKVYGIYFLLLLPIKINYFYTYNQFTINAFDGFNLWNNASVLYPNSKYSSNPETEFEKWLQKFPKETFKLENALITNHIWEDSFPANSFKVRNSLEIIEINNILKETALKLMKEQPWQYFTKFVIPNFVKPLSRDEILPLKVTQPFIQEYFQYSDLASITYYSIYWKLFLFLYLFLWVYFILNYKSLMNLMPFHFLILSYLIGTSFMGAFFLRYLYLIFPLILWIFIESIFNIIVERILNPKQILT